MARLDPAIHVLLGAKKGVDARDKPGHDEETRPSYACALHPAGTITTPLSFGQRTRHAKLISLTSPAFASNAHSSTPRLSWALVAVVGVVCGSISTTMSSFSLTGS